MLIFASSLLTTGLLFLVFSISNVTDEFWRTFLNSISTILIVSALWTAVNHYLLRKEFEELHQSHTNEILTAISAIDIASKLGLHQVYESIDDYDCTRLIKTAQSITILVDDIDPWLTRYSEFIEDRFLDKTKFTTILISIPENNNGSSFKGQFMTNQRLDLLKSMTSEDITNLNLRSYNFVAPYKAYCFDKNVVMTPLFVGHKNIKAIALEFEKTGAQKCYFEKIKIDMDSIIARSKKL